MVHGAMARCLALLVVVGLPACSAFLTPVILAPRASGSVLRRVATLSRRNNLPKCSVATEAASREFAEYTPTPPPVSPATGLPNNIYTWRNQQIRYQVSGPEDATQAAVLVHGLFVNADHWRHTLTGLGKAGYRVYALDLLGCGWSSKPPRDSGVACRINGENGRFDGCDMPSIQAGKVRGPSVLADIELGTAAGGSRVADVDLRHPLGSVYNFFTWSEQISDFTREVVLRDSAMNKATLIANSIGTISSLQCMIDAPDIFNGLCVVNPNFRELHSAEIPFPGLAMPVIRGIQQLLRDKGQGLFTALAKRDTVAQILKEPYAVTSAIDDKLLTVLLDPLLTKGASDVVFDTLSYSAGPLPEQQLSSPAFPADAPVWVLYGEKDPWTPAQRVERLGDLPSVDKVVALEGVGHCPHDEAPELVNPLLVQFLQLVGTRG
jgi:pimeloyl-ACP methyl ester carboxylesterase